MKLKERGLLVIQGPKPPIFLASRKSSVVGPIPGDFGAKISIGTIFSNRRGIWKRRDANEWKI
jgi:hypothetical protein